jgi:prepilin-type N-terminal cleavage/methylation domain-containing protein
MAPRQPAEAGFTLIELLVVLAIVVIAVLIGLPALQNMIHRAQIEGGVRQAAVELRAAKLEAVKKSATTYVEADFANDRLVTWRETGADGFTPATDEEVREMRLPSRVTFWGPADASPEGADATKPAGQLYLTFLSSGAAEDSGAFRFSDGHGNFLEVQVDPPATARVAIRKWDGTDWFQQGENGQRWEWQ